MRVFSFKTESGKTTDYLNDINLPYTQVLQTFGEDDKVQSTYTYGVQRIKSQGEINETYLYDGHGSVSGVVTDSSKVINYSYTAYGDLLPDSPTPNTFGYNAEATDFNTGLQYLRARYYNTNTGRFIQKDEYNGDFTQPGTLNRYAYCAGNPVNRIDPSGYRTVEGAGGGNPSTPTTETPEGVGFECSGDDVKSQTTIDLNSTIDFDEVIISAAKNDALPPWTAEYYDGYKGDIPIIDTWFMEILEINALYTQYRFKELDTDNANMLVAEHRSLFTKLVTDNAPMDIKKTLDFKYSQYWFNGELVDTEDLGNINYGYIGSSIGISKLALKKGSLQNAKQKANQAKENALKNGATKEDARKIRQVIMDNERNIDRPQIVKGIELYNEKNK